MGSFRRRQHVVAPALLLLGLAGALVAGWKFVGAREHAALQALTDQLARNVADHVQSTMDGRISLLRFVAKRGAEPNPPSEVETERNVAALRQEFPGLVRISRIGPDLVIRSVYPHTPTNESLLGRHLATLPAWPYVQRVVATRQPIVTPVLTLSIGGRGVVIYFPHMRSGRLIGLTSGVLHVGDILNAAAIASENPHFAVDVRDGMDSLFIRTPGPIDPEFVAVRTVRVLDREWTVRVSPAVTYVSALRAPTKNLILGLGLLAAFGMAALLSWALRAYARTQESERRFRDLVEGSVQGVYVVQNRSLLFANPVLLRLFGANSKAELQSLMNSWQHVAPHDRERVQAINADRMAGKTVPESYELDFVRKDGKQFRALIMSRMVQWEGRPASQVTTIDITERKRAEEALRKSEQRLSEAQRIARLGAWELDLRTHEEWWSDEQYRINGIPNESGRPDHSVFMNLVHPEDRAAIDQAFQTVLAKGSFEAEYRIVRPDGKVRHLHGLAQVSYDRDGVPVSLAGINQDITERKRAEDGLRANQKLLQTILDTLPVYVTVKDRAGRYQIVNRLFRDSLPPSVGDLMGRTVEDIPDALDARPKWVLEAERRLLETGEGQRIDELPTQPVPGEEQWQRLTKLPLRDESGQITNILTISEDITERKRAEDGLRANQRLLQTILDTLPVFVSVKDRAGRYQIVNRRMRDSLPPSVGDLVGRTAEDNPIASESRREWVREAERRLLKTGEVQRNDELPTQRMGKEAWERVTKLPLRDEAGEINGILTVGEDITERKRNEAERGRLASAVEHAGDGILIADRNGAIEYVNPALEIMSGYSKAELIGNTPRLLSSGVRSAEFYAALWNTILSGDTWSGRYVNRTKGGMAYTADSTIAPIRDAAGNITHFVAVYRDITRHLRLEEQLQRSRRMDAIGVLAGGIAHDFNNLLSPILGYAELLKEDAAADPDRAALVGPILDAARRGRDLTQRILSFSRRTSAPREPIQIAAIVGEVLALLRSTLPPSIAIQPAIAAGMAPVEADASQLHEVLMNLCINAAQAMPDGGTLGVRVDPVELREQPNYLGKPLSGNFVRIEVSDTGAGMTEEVMSRLFEPFFTTKDVGKGTGLGLSSVLGIVQEHGGAVDVRTHLGEGSTFTVYLPRVTEAALELTDPGPAPLGGTESILCVDDEPMIAALLSKTLERLGYQVSVFVDPAVALAALHAEPHRFDLVISDLAMPEIAGDLLARRIHEIRADLPVLLCTGNDERLPGPAERTPNIAGVLQKPIERGELSRAVRRILDKSALAASN